MGPASAAPVTAPSGGFTRDGPASMTASGDGPPGEGPALPAELNPRGPQPRREATPSEPRRRRRKRVLAWVAGSLAALLAIGGVTSWAAISHFLGNITKINVFGGLT